MYIWIHTGMHTHLCFHLVSLFPDLTSWTILNKLMNIVFKGGTSVFSEPIHAYSITDTGVTCPILRNIKLAPYKHKALKKYYFIFKWICQKTRNIYLEHLWKCIKSSGKYALLQKYFLKQEYFFDIFLCQFKIGIFFKANTSLSQIIINIRSGFLPCITTLAGIALALESILCGFCTLYTSSGNIMIQYQAADNDIINPVTAQSHQLSHKPEHDI